MTIQDLYQKLADKDFQDPATGSMYWPVYLYGYKPEDEYQIRSEIESLKERLKRPDNYIHAKVINIFEELLRYLESESYGDSNMLEQVLNAEEEDPENIAILIANKAADPAFFRWLHLEVERHLEQPNPNAEKRSYLFIHGFGEVYPYLRASKFVTNYEQYTRDKYKIILFYPGRVGRKYQLFGSLPDVNPYRAIELINDPYEDS